MTTTPRARAGPVRAAFDRLGHLAVWAGLYVAGALGALAILAGVPGFPATRRDAVALGVALAVGISVYIVDRAKLADRLLDPADRHAHPDRYDFVTRRRAWLRAGAGVLGVAGAVGAALLHPALPLVIAGAYVGALLYAGAPARTVRRVKDVLILKNLAVAASITSLAAALLLAARRDDPGALATIAGAARTLALPCLLLGAVVFADAALCDLDDATSDRHFGTRTIPGVVSARATWRVASGVHVLAGVAIVAAHRGVAPIILGVGLPATTLALWWRRPSRVRDLVDARLVLLVAIALALA